MNDLIARSNITVVVGMGITGLSVARYLRRQQQAFVWVDTRSNPPSLKSIREEFPDLNLELGDLREETLQGAGEIILSPGVPLTTPAIAAAVAAGVPVVGDIELFLRETQAPVVAITGSNAKSTVTTLVGEMAQASGRRVGVGGNLGVPVLQLLDSPADLYVIELSSFQLETVQLLGADVACVLNISEDHMDRYASMMDYHRAKQRIYFGAGSAVYNRDDPLSAPPLARDVRYYTFGMSAPDRGGFGVIRAHGEPHLAFEFEPLMPCSHLRMAGSHNVSNALAALAIGHSVGLPMAEMLATLETFPGLPHRCQWVAEFQGVTWYNDSKGTNVGATCAAIEGVKPQGGGVVLIAGGVGKGADFAPLAARAGALRALIYMGEDGEKIATILRDHVPVFAAGSMEEAVRVAQELSARGDCVLLSPACASFDMFSGFEDRGEQFERAVAEVIS